MSLKGKLVSLSCCAVITMLAPAILWAGNLYSSASGDLLIPVLQVDDSSSYSVNFTLISEEPIIWGANNFTETLAEARTAAIYNAETTSLWVPEINVDGQLYSLNFRITTSCGFTLCLEPDETSVQSVGRDGALVFTSALSSASTFSCSSCHAMKETDGYAADGLRRPGHDLFNASRRVNYKNGQYSEFLDAVNTCVTEWMNAAPLSATDSDWVNMLNWFEDQSSVAEAEPISIELVSPPADVSGGDAAIGRLLFNETCIVCHGFNGEGTSLAPKITDLELPPSYIASRVRTSGLSNSSVYTGLSGGIMPFWGADRLSDSELIDIVAYVTAGTASEFDSPDPEPTNGNNNTSCGSDHAKVGQVASLSNLFHDVEGTATIVDDCTIEITDFDFDGGGIDVRVYLGSEGEFHSASGGFAISEDLVGIIYSGNTLRLTLPEGKSLDDFNSISIWCVAVGVSFGTGFFN